MHSKINFFEILLVIPLVLSCDQKKVEFTYEYVDYVNPFISTDSYHGQTDPTTAVPFEMVKLAPDTYPVAHYGEELEACFIDFNRLVA